MATNEERMEALERKVRRQRRWNISLGVMLVVGGLMAAEGLQEVPDVIRAKKFEVVDKDGKARLSLGLEFGGDVGPYLALMNKQEKPVAGLGVGVKEQSGGLFLSREDGSMYAVMKSADGNSEFALADKKGDTKVAMLLKGSQPFIGCWDPKGHCAVQMTVGPSGPAVSLAGPDGSLEAGGAIFGSSPAVAGGGMVGLYNMDGRLKELRPFPPLTSTDRDLLKACRKDGVSVSRIQELIQSGADVNCVSYSFHDLAQGIDTNMTPLMLAAENQTNPAIVSALLEAGANARAKSSLDKTALALARENKKLNGTKAIQELESVMKASDPKD